MRGGTVKVNSFIGKSGIVVYIVALILSGIFNMAGFEIINVSIINVLKVLYFIILLWGIISFYQNKQKNAKSLLLIFLPIFLLFTGIPFKVVTMIIVLSLFSFKDITRKRKIIGISIYSIFIALGIFGMWTGEFGANTIIDSQYSSNKIYRVVTIDSDQGALGGDTYVDLEKIYFGVIKRDLKTLYAGKWGEKPKVRWIDNNTVNINDRNMNIQTSDTWKNKN